jgi:NAD(P)-dependent dehydrogenase (short-subunit alcohol dehydrogenase family)
MMKKSLVKKVALVTGGSRGIGAAIVRRLAGEGAHVAFTYSTSEKAAKTLLKEISGGGRLPGRAGCDLYHRCDAQRGWGLERLISVPL